MKCESPRGIPWENKMKKYLENQPYNQNILKELLDCCLIPFLLNTTTPMHIKKDER